LDRNENGVVEFEEFVQLMEERIDTRSMAPGVNCTNVLRAAFMLVGPKSAK